MAHFLKRLELTGFKSFAQKTVLEFPSGITAIVGPNGSGKSNIVDAIRWLLGERDAKNLRGAKVEDLIFAGTPKRARVGIAQASLHFENQNKFFPVDFAEVAVTRQVSRDGASKYFLNSSEVLLRDLIDFFAKARLGSRGLIVISQGNSDVFIQSSPSGRREMIEEILGLREYQMKKSEAERRLKNTQVNLEKARALIEEILPHLRSLKRQTARWEKREVLERELHDLENQFFGTEWLELTHGIAQIDEALAHHKKALHALEENKRVAESAQKKVELEQPKEQQALRDIKEQTQKLLDDRSRLQKEIGRLEAHIEFEEKRVVMPGAPAASVLVSTLKDIRNELRAMHGKTVEELHAIVKNVLSSIDKVLEEPKEQKVVALPVIVQAELQKISKDLAALEEEMRLLKEQEQALEKNQEHFYFAFKDAVAGVEVAKDAIEKWESERQRKEFERERITLRLNELERQIKAAGRAPEEFAHVTPGERVQDVVGVERRILRLRGDLASIGEIDEALLKEATDTEARYESLRAQLEDLEKAKGDLRSLIKDLQEKIKTEFEGALHKINSEFNTFFQLMFGGGQAKLKIQLPKEKIVLKSDEDEEGAVPPSISEEGEGVAKEEHEEVGGLDIAISLPRKRIGSLEMLSGGERSLVGIAALFALISVSPPPFLVLDEIDAALDERNARRFSDMLIEFSKKTQFLVVTHNRATMEAANILYGVTLNEDGSSKVLSLKLEK